MVTSTFIGVSQNGGPALTHKQSFPTEIRQLQQTKRFRYMRRKRWREGWTSSRLSWGPTCGGHFFYKKHIVSSSRLKEQKRLSGSLIWTELGAGGVRRPIRTRLLRFCPWAAGEVITHSSFPIKNIERSVWKHLSTCCTWYMLVLINPSWICCLQCKTMRLDFTYKWWGSDDDMKTSRSNQTNERRWRVWVTSPYSHQSTGSSSSPPAPCRSFPLLSFPSSSPQTETQTHVVLTACLNTHAHNDLLSQLLARHVIFQIGGARRTWDLPTLPLWSIGWRIGHPCSGWTEMTGGHLLVVEVIIE